MLFSGGVNYGEQDAAEYRSMLRQVLMKRGALTVDGKTSGGQESPDAQGREFISRQWASFYMVAESGTDMPLLSYKHRAICLLSGRYETSPTE
jgi:hypothetical protein